MSAVLRRKLGGTAQGGGAGGAGSVGAGADRALRLALGRAAQGEMSLALLVTGLWEDPQSLAEILETVEPGMFFGILEGREDALGLMALSPEVLAAVIEHLTTGSIAEVALPKRKPTRIDAAMAMPMIDRILSEFELALADQAGSGDGQDWARGYRYASFLDDPRPLGLLLEDRRYRVFRAAVALGSVARAGDIVLALPADPAPAQRGGAAAGRAEAAFRAGLQGAVLDAPTRLEAVLTRLRLPLSTVMGWTEGALVPLPMARPGEMTLEAPRGRAVARVKLGQVTGARAVRLLPEAPRADTAAPAQPHAAAAVAGGPVPGAPPAPTTAGQPLPPETLQAAAPAQDHLRAG